ncbi:hypothetical protein BT63DRAFT_464767 [Microthyrium microscopicum]|uniref:Uncharacterized protein n=1 Tax=Microthyrium microscopicum TaxID=703497 RepID=A0A6A6TZC9_9PEZI|nr:hypothetical protein BT63DRAFT_464767 [Microthyrium microscopicum]
MATSVTLQSKDHRDLLDIIDKLRSKGISRYVDLPEIIVCGDQSSGKSSVLEAISGISFPTKDALCTRFATELVLRRDVSTGIKISIIPGPERSVEEKVELARFRRDIPEVDVSTFDLGETIEGAKWVMGLSEEDAKVFSTDTLRVELCGPNQPHLTMVDLPGIFRAGNRDQSTDDAKIVRSMVRGYMERPRSIILAVVSAKSDFALQEVTELARKLDRKGMRTLGLITKPDTLDAGSDSEAAYFKLAQNKDVVFRLGWHVLKNRSYETRAASSAQRDADEESFFSLGIWTSLDPSQLGVKPLKSRLSNVLKDQILYQLPSLLEDVEAGISGCRSRLDRLGISRITTNEQRRYLLQISQQFTALIKAAVDGIYDDRFFGSSKTMEGRQKRLRAVVQDSLNKFKDDMRLNGETRIIVEGPVGDDDSAGKKVARSDYIQEVSDMIQRSRGRELQGMFNPLIVGELFTDQCQPWKKIAVSYKDTILEAVYWVTGTIINHISVDETAAAIFQFVRTGIETLKLGLDEKVKELLGLHYSGHPITYNHYFTDNVQKAQAARKRRALEEALKSYFGKQDFNRESEYNVDPSKLLTLLEERTEVDMEKHASDAAIDYMQAYYKVALKRFVDDVSVLAIEHCLIGQLSSLFEAMIVYEMEEEDVARLAGESKETAVERGRCAEQLTVLEGGLKDLKRLDKHRTESPG